MVTGSEWIIGQCILLMFVTVAWTITLCLLVDED